MWKLCDGSRDFEQVVAAVTDDLRRAADVIRQDVQAFVDEMVNERLLDAGS